jgi:hypothetical protein
VQELINDLSLLQRKDFFNPKDLSEIKLCITDKLIDLGIKNDLFDAMDKTRSEITKNMIMLVESGSNQAK